MLELLQFDFTSERNNWSAPVLSNLKLRTSLKVTNLHYPHEVWELPITMHLCPPAGATGGNWKLDKILLFLLAFIWTYKKTQTKHLHQELQATAHAILSTVTRGDASIPKKKKPTSTSPGYTEAIFSSELEIYCRRSPFIYLLIVSKCTFYPHFSNRTI